MTVPALRPDGDHPSVSFEMLPIAKIRANPRNARRHSSKQRAALLRSVSKFGFLVPAVVDEKNLLLSGHARVEAAKKLGMPTIPVVRAEHLRETEKRAFMLADNRLAQLANWDKERLQHELQFLNEIDFDFSAIGFEAAEIEFILETDADRRPDSGARAKSRRKVANAPAVSGCGDVWRLGEHFISCGGGQCAEVDRLIRSWQADTGADAVNARSGQSFNAIERALGAHNP